MLREKHIYVFCSYCSYCSYCRFCRLYCRICCTAVTAVTAVMRVHCVLMRAHCVLCVRIAQNAFALRFMHLCIAFYACALRFNCVLYICIALYACALRCMQTNQLPPPLHCTVCVCIACALRCMHVLCTSICIGPRQ